MTNTIIKASAGSGKTFRLGNRYLQIIFERKPVETILASTFTRKAAGEILDRILQRLASAALDETSREELGRFVELPKPIRTVSHSTAKTVADDDGRTLREFSADLARNLYRLRIGTFDSFFNKIASTFALELGLPPGWSILEETDFSRFVGEAIRTVLGDSERNDARRLMHLMHRGEQDRSITRELHDLAMQLLPIVRETTPDVWNHEELLSRELDAGELRRLLERYGAAEIPKNKDGTLPKRFAEKKEKIGLLANDGQWKTLLRETMVKNVVSGDNKFDRKNIEGDLLDAVEGLIRQARAVQINKWIGQTLATRKILDLIVREYDQILYRERGFRFEDVTERLGRRDFAQHLDTLAHRMDASTDHLLLDEFQDTSMSQWKVLRAFAEEVAAKPGGSFFCVGDVKQAIYAWRGGEAGIFEAIKSEIPDCEEDHLNVSFRSSPIVIDTVNGLFGTIGANEALSGHPEAVATWAERFERHEAAKKDLSGFCVLETVPDADEFKENSFDENEPPDDDPDPDRIFFDHVVRRVEGLHRTRPGKSIGILVARNKMIGALIAGLKRRGIEASEEGGNPLTDSAAVQQVLSAMILADHPGDRIVRFHLAGGPLAEHLGLTDFEDDRQAEDASLRIRKELVSDGYPAVVERLAERLAPSCNPREFQRLEKLAELARRYQETARGVRTERFVRTVRTTRIESPTASPIRVMTVHKSKGLEFDIVVLPDLDVDLVKRAPQLVVQRDTPTSPIKRVFRYVGEELQNLLPPDYRKAFADRIRGEVEESLSLLYVAVTRAIHELVMIVPPLKKTGREKLAQGKPTFSATFAGILRAGLGPKQADSEPEILFQYGNPDWFRELRDIPGTEKDSDGAPEILVCSLAKKPAGPPRNLPRITPSGLEASLAERDDTETVIVPETEVFSASPPFDARDRDEARLRGIAMHACFEHGLGGTPWLDRAAVPGAETLLPVVRKALAGQPGKTDPDRVIAAFLEACGKPEIRKALSLDSYEKGCFGTAADRTASLRAPHWTVEHERRFTVRLPGDRLLRGSVDRLVVLRDGDRVVGLDILDYKTDRPKPGEDVGKFLAGRVAAYAPQLDAYRDGMSRLFCIEKSAVTARLVFVELDRVVEPQRAPEAGGTPPESGD